MKKLAVALVFLGLNFYVYRHLATTEVTPERLTFSSFPLVLGTWACPERETMDLEVRRNLGATDYLLCSYYRETPPTSATVYVGYHGTQVRKEGGGAGENSIHPPEHCLPGSGWDVIDARVVPLTLNGLPTNSGRAGEAKRFIIARGNARQLVYFWYQSRGRVLARNHEVILYRFFDRAARSRTDGSLVRITIPILRDDEDAAERAFRQFAHEFVPRLDGFIPN